MARATKKQDAAETKQQDGAETETNPQIDTRTKELPAAERPTGQVVATRKMQVFAAVCPRNERHQATRVYKTAGKTRYCVCDDCGHTWKQVGEPADPLAEYCQKLIGTLEGLAEDPQTSADGEPCVCLTVAEVLGITDDLRLILQS